MKIELLIIFLVLFSCAEKTKNSISESSNNLIVGDTLFTNTIELYHRDFDTIVLGDMNGDGKDDTAFSISPLYNLGLESDIGPEGCQDDSCLTKIYFSFDSTILYHNSALGCQIIFPTEDLNSDGIKEIAFIPNWFQSCWQGLYVYSLIDANWSNIGTGTVFACSDEDFSARVRKINSDKFEIISMKWNDDGGEIIDTIKTFNFDKTNPNIK